MIRLLIVSMLGVSCLGRQVNMKNNCGYTIWTQPETGKGGPMPDGGIQGINAGASYAYQIPDSGWEGRYWAKTGCDGSGQNCAYGQTLPPCPANGCQPPANTLAEFKFQDISSGQVWYDISMVDGFSLPIKIVPSAEGGSCVTTVCSMSLDQCPSGENNVGDLRYGVNGQTVSCLSPCQAWIKSGGDKMAEPGLSYCCPTPPVTPEQCRGGSIKDTQYVNLVRKLCPTAYSYAYDDVNGLHNCDPNTSFEVTFCP